MVFSFFVLAAWFLRTANRVRGQVVSMTSWSSLECLDLPFIWI
jgi:hypothetical protein